MKKFKMRALAALLGLTLITGSVGTATVALASEDNSSVSTTSGTTSDGSRVPVYNDSIGYGEYLEKYASAASAEEEIVLKGSDYSETTMDVTVEGDDVVTGEEGSISWTVNAPSAGLYEIEVEYFVHEIGGNKVQMSLSINGEVPFAQAATLVFGRMYMDQNKDFLNNTNGNQTFPSQEEYPGLQKVSLYDQEGYYAGALKFYLKKGKNTISFEALRDNMTIRTITLKPVTVLPTYEEYLDNYADAEVITTTEAERVQAEDTTYKSSSSFRPLNDRTSPVTEPYHATYIVLNTIGGSSWSGNGDWLEWDVEVPKTGLYKLAVRYQQSDNAGFSSFRTVSVNGEVPFAEAASVAFPYSSSFSTMNVSDANGNELLFYLEAGKTNTIRFTVSLGTYSDIVTEVDAVIEELTAVYQSITAITGTAPNTYMDYQLTTRIPTLVDDFLAIADHMQEVKDSIIALTGSESDVSSSMTRAIDLLKEISEKPSKIQTKVTSIADNITALGSNIMTLTSQPLTLDWIQPYGNEQKLPKASGSFWQSIVHEIKSFIGSFTNDYTVQIEGETDKDAKTITVWVSTGRDQMDVLRRLINESFTPEKGIQVDLKLVDANIIMTAIAAGTGPDVAIGVGNTLPLELAFRGAAYDLSTFEDFDEVSEQFMDAAMDCYLFEDSYYGIPDQMSFSVMFYRKDILAQYNVAVPETWDDLISIIPTLATYNMEAYLDKNTVSTLGAAVSVGSSKAINGVYLSMLYQAGAELYNEERTEALLDKKESVACFTTWTDFYKKYGFSTTIDFVTRFRLGSVPIAIMDISNYNRLSISAPEIAGKWSVALVPGTMKEDGTIDHSTPVVTSAAMMIKDSVKRNDSADASWEFLKWWTSASTQESYSTEMESVLGSSGRYMVSNIEAFQNVSWSVDVAKVLNNSLQWLREVKQLPGGYMTGLNLDNAFYQVINNSTDEPIDVITEYNETLNAEIEKKRSEFGLDK